LEAQSLGPFGAGAAYFEAKAGKKIGV